MRTHVLICTTLLAASVASPALAQTFPTRNDCGPVIGGYYSTSTYCGTYTESNGGTLICACGPQTECVGPNNVINPQVNLGNGNSTPGDGVCTTDTGDICGGNITCTGDSRCVSGKCCVPLQCPAFVCGTASDGCGALEMCATAPGCVIPTLTITPEFPSLGAIQLPDWTGVAIQNGLPNAVVKWVLLAPDGSTVDWTKSPADRTDANGNLSNGALPPFTFTEIGMWSVYASMISLNPYGATQSNTVHVEVIQ